MKRLFFIIISLFFVVSIFAQRRKPQLQPYADQKVFHYGFHVGMHSQDLEFFHTGVPTTSGETWFAEIPTHNMGFNVGILGDLYLTNSFNLRLSPSLYFGDKAITFRESKTGTVVKTSLRSNLLVIPIHLKYSSKRLNNRRPYLVTGPSIAFELARKNGERLKARSVAFYWEVGVGCNFYFPYFKLCPELKFCFGLNDVLETDRSDLRIKEYEKFTTALDRMTSRLVVLSFNFE